VTSPGPRSGLIVTVPEAESAVREHRLRLDASAALGVPAHLTVLFPFLPPADIDAGVLVRLERLFAGVSAFSFQLDHAAWFGDEVLWLGPREPVPFRALTQRAYRAFPAFPPFEGQFEEVVPHLTIGYGHPVADLRAAEAAIQPCLPVAAHAGAVTLFVQGAAGGPWGPAAVFPLA
jgi:2'-5' RNA ligase